MRYGKVFVTALLCVLAGNAAAQGSTATPATDAGVGQPEHLDAVVVTGKVAGFGIALGGVMLAGLLVMVLSIPVIMATWYAPALVFLHDMKPIPAMKASFNAGATNWLPMVIFAVFLVVSLFFAMLPLGLGLILLLPVFSGAVFASYRDVFVGT